MEKINSALIKQINFKKNNDNAHKYNWGYSLIIAGSENMLGAALMAAESALETGSGIVVVAVAQSQINFVMQYRPELMAIAYEDEKLLLNHIQKATAVCIGPGLVSNDYFKKVVELLVTLDKPVIIDAGALKALKEILVAKKQITNQQIIITPHHGEFKQLIGQDIKQIETAAQKFVSDYPQMILVLKGAPTKIYTQKQIYDNQVVNAKFASAGMGDVLAGIVCGIATQHPNALEAAVFAVYIHSLVATEISKSQYKVNASDVINGINQQMHLINCQ